MKYLIFIATILFFSSTNINSQNHVDVSIIVANEADAAIMGFAVAPESNAPSFTAGVRGVAQTANGIGIYGQGPTAIRGDQDESGFYAGLFLGNVNVMGTFTNPSDKKLKTIIKNSQNVLPMILQLKPTIYKYKTKDFSNLNLRKGIQTGFIAQELEEVFPRMVSDYVLPESYDVDGSVISPRLEYKAVNYIDLIPVLTQGIQELSAIVQVQSEEIERLKEEIIHLKD